MAIRVKIHTKLFLAFLAVGLLSIFVGVYVPMREISRKSPQESRELLGNVERNIFLFYEIWSKNEPLEVSQKLNRNPEFIRSFEEKQFPTVLEILEEQRQELGYKNRFVKILYTPEEFSEWSSKLHRTDESVGDVLRLFKWPISDPPSRYVAGAARPIKNSEGEILGGLLIGRPMIVKDPDITSDPDYLYDENSISSVFQEFHNVSINVIGAESRKFQKTLEEWPDIRSRLLEEHLTCRLDGVEIVGVASQLIFVPVEDAEGTLIDVVYLQTPLPPETQIWNTLMGTFYYGIVIAVVLAFVMAYFVSRTISRPIKQLSEGALALSKGDMDYPVSVKTQDEVGDLAKIFMDMRHRLKQIRRQEHLAALGTLSAGIAHEIRNPLGIIQGSAEILKKRFGHLKEEEGLAQFIIDEVGRLSSLVTEFLDFARPRQPHFIPTDLNQIIHRSLQLADLQRSFPTVSPTLELDEDLPTIEVDSGQCQQAFLNLILNAAQAMPDGGHLILKSSSEPDSQEINVEVCDSGSGIDDDNRALIFNPFFTTKDGGAGLGLSIVHKIVENHQARITVESNSEHGTTFRISFPISRTVEF